MCLSDKTGCVVEESERGVRGAVVVNVQGAWSVLEMEDANCSANKDDSYGQGNVRRGVCKDIF